MGNKPNGKKKTKKKNKKKTNQRWLMLIVLDLIWPSRESRMRQVVEGEELKKRKEIRSRSV